jgi:hypothetical protein
MSATRHATFLPLLVLLACTGADLGDSAESAKPDLTADLGADEVRAGVVEDPRALFGGISAEGAPGDVKLYNDRVQFIIEAVGDSSYYNDYGGNLIDADIIRPDGQPGRDMVDELAPMVSLGRVVDATAVTVVSDGGDGAAHVRVSGPAAPLRLVTGAVENLETVPYYDLFVVTDYVLRPGEWSVEVTTTLENRDARAFGASLGLFGFYAQEIAQPWRPRSGYGDPDGEAVAMEGLLGSSAQGALAMMAGSGELQPSPIGDLISGLGAGATAFDVATTLAPGESYTWTSRLGVAPDLATLEAERLARAGVEDAGLSGTVQAAGARASSPSTLRARPSPWRSPTAPGASGSRPPTWPPSAPPVAARPSCSISPRATATCRPTTAAPTRSSPACSPAPRRSRSRRATASGSRPRRRTASPSSSRRPGC